MKDNKLGTLVRDITAVPPSKSRTKRLIKEYLLDYISKEEVEKIIEYIKKYQLGSDYSNGYSSVESGECCDKCKMKEEHFNSRADALKAIVGCRNPFQLKETCECHLPFRKVAEESIQQVLLEEILKEIEKI